MFFECHKLSMPSSCGEETEIRNLTSPASAPFAARAAAGRPNPLPAPTTTAPVAGSNEMVAAIFWSASSRVVGAASCTPVSLRCVGDGDVGVVAVPDNDICWMLLRGSSRPKLYAVKLHAANRVDQSGCGADGCVP